jgi:L-lactate dehydrogenase complex protein LldG
MSSKSEILARIRKRLPESTPLPDLNGPWISYPEREKQFVEVLSFVGGQTVVAESPAGLAALVREMPAFQSARQIVCTVPELNSGDGAAIGNFDLSTINDPHDVASFDLAILPGEFAVAENGAVWVSGQTVKHRAIYFLTQHLVLVVPRSQMVDHMHQAYERLKFEGSGYGLFISGPSKTADIEQSLVIGAHGPRSLTVVLLGT